MRIDELTKEVQQIRWFHTIDLGNGVITPGIDNSPQRLEKLGMPEDLRGMTVLDIGAYNGFFSFEAERRGADRVVACDFPSWTGKEEGKRGFDLARRALNSKVEDIYMDVFDISPESIGSFDLVLFLGVLYHLKHPLLALERVFSVTGRRLILETHVDMIYTRRPAMVFYPNAELDKNPSNWWGPNPAAIEAMLRTVGFRRVEKFSEMRSRTYKLGAAAYLWLKGYAQFFSTLQQNRVVFHAWR
jgi:tRNA (mo5U34)-methyltransferase